jgi:hypothetical protein
MGSRLARLDNQKFGEIVVSFAWMFFGLQMAPSTLVHVLFRCSVKAKLVTPASEAKEEGKK